MAESWRVPRVPEAGMTETSRVQSERIELEQERFFFFRYRTAKWSSKHTSTSTSHRDSAIDSRVRVIFGMLSAQGTWR